MRKMTGERAKSLRAKGVKVTDSNGGHYRPEPVKPKPAEVPAPVVRKSEQPDPSVLVAMVKSIETNGTNVSRLMDITSAISSNLAGTLEGVLAEMKKPKEKRCLVSTVSRGKDGKIESVRTVES